MSPRNTRLILLSTITSFFFPSHLLSLPLFFFLPRSRNSDPGSHSRLFFFFWNSRIFQFFSLVDLRRTAVLTHARRSHQLPLILFCANRFKISPRRDSNSRANTINIAINSSIRELPLLIIYHLTLRRPVCTPLIYDVIPILLFLSYTRRRSVCLYFPYPTRYTARHTRHTAQHTWYATGATRQHKNKPGTLTCNSSCATTATTTNIAAISQQYRGSIAAIS